MTDRRHYECHTRKYTEAARVVGDEAFSAVRPFPVHNRAGRPPRRGAVVTSRDDDREPDRQGTGIALWLAWLAAEYGPLPVRGSRSADEIIGHDAAALPG
jgi:hypothetical protein